MHFTKASSSVWAVLTDYPDGGSGTYIFGNRPLCEMMSCRLGRKALLIQGGIQMTVCQIITAIILATQMDKSTGTMPPAAGKAVLAFICLFVAGQTVLCLPT